MSKLNDMAEIELVRVELAELHLGALRFVAKGLYGEYPSYDDKVVQEAESTLYQACQRRLLDAYRHLFIVSRLVPNKDVREAADKVVRKWFGDPDCAVMQHLNVEGRLPGRYLVSEVEAFRKELGEAMAKLEEDE